MAYTKHVWKDEIVQFPSRYKLKDIGTGAVVATYNLEREVGTVTEASDPITAPKLNNMESAIDEMDEYIRRNSDYVSTYRLQRDAFGVYKEVEYKTQTGVLLKKTVLSGGTVPFYTTRTVTYYAENGTTPVYTITYTLTYTNNELVSEVMV